MGAADLIIYFGEVYIDICGIPSVQTRVITSCVVDLSMATGIRCAIVRAGQCAHYRTPLYANISVVIIAEIV